MLTDLEICLQNKMDKIEEIAKKINLDLDLLENYGKYKAKIDFEKVQNMVQDPKLILVTAINPTKAGEGKSTTTIGLADGLNRIGKEAIVALREPSLGPVMGLKGGACGGGYAQVVPMEDINLHFTGDLHAITTANNLISAVIDNSIHQGNPLNIDVNRITWKRCVDLNDRALRDIIIGLGGKSNGIPRQDGFNITVASEIMAVLCLANDLNDLKERISRIIIGFNTSNEPVYVKDLKIEGSLTVLLKDAIKPNLVQTLEHTPAIIHGGPFANIAHGCNSVIATKTCMKLREYTVTEAGFGADLGMEKFLDIKCRKAGLKPNCIVLVATIRALKLHGNEKYENLKEENLEALKAGMCNLAHHINSVKKFNVPFVVALNRFASDTEAELEYVLNYAKENGFEISLSEVFTKGSLGAEDLANKVVNLIENTSNENFKQLYDVNDKIKVKIKKIATEIYGAKEVIYTDKANQAIRRIEKLGLDKVEVCMAKTPMSLSDNPKLVGEPKDFSITINDVRISNGAGFVVCLLGDIMTMPGLPKEPACEKIDINDGVLTGLF